MTDELNDFPQLALSIGLKDDCTLETFYPGNNLQILKAVKKVAQGEGEQFVYLWGRIGVGCTHLLQGACNDAGRFGMGSVYLPLQDLMEQSPQKLLGGLERLALVCLDNIEAICGKSSWEEALFYLFNRLRGANHKLIVAANCSPPSLALGLDDLKSRLAWGMTYQIQPLDEAQLLAALQLRARQRGLVLTKEVGEFLIRRAMRSMSHLYELLEKLDKAQLAAQRRLTIPFVKSVLAL